jgi:hypothetical protein
MGPIHSSRPILAIDTAPPPTHRHPIPVPREVYPGDVRNTSTTIRPMPDPAPTSSTRTSAPSEFLLSIILMFINVKLVTQG